MLYNITLLLQLVQALFHARKLICYCQPREFELAMMNENQDNDSLNTSVITSKSSQK